MISSNLSETKDTLTELISPTPVSISQAYTCTQAGTLQDTFIAVSIPANSIYSLTAEASYGNSPVNGVAISIDSKIIVRSLDGSGTLNKSVSLSGFTDKAIWVGVLAANTTPNVANGAVLKGYYQKLK